MRIVVTGRQRQARPGRRRRAAGARPRGLERRPRAVARADRRSLHSRRSHRLRPGVRVVRGASTRAGRRSTDRPPGGDPGAGPGAERGAVREQHQGSYNVFAAARHAGIRNIVWASSETLLGLPFDTPPPYVPLDEDYPVRPETAYSLAKALDEEMARHFCRWDPTLKMIGLRFSNVMEPADYARFPAFDADALLRKWNLWGYIDARDGAQASAWPSSHDRDGDGRLHRRERRHRDEPLIRGPPRRGLSRRARPERARRARDAPLDRQGAAGPGLRAPP